MIRFILNEKEVATSLPPGTVLLDYIRYHRHLSGTKIGCREGDCGACTVLIGEIRNNELHYQSMTSCLLAIGNIQGKHVVTIEGINLDELNPIQEAMAIEGATQCGFCTPGFVMSLAGFCLSDKEATPQNAIAAIDGNICRCTGYKSIERAAARVTVLLKERKTESPVSFTSNQKILPAYFTGIQKRLQQMIDSEKARLVPEPASLQERPHLVGGGTDLYVQKHDELVNAPVHFITNRPELKSVIRKDNKCIIGPPATVTDLKESTIINELFPFFQQYAKLVSSTPIRNMATIAGNFVNASPIGDFSIFFLAMDAQLVLSNDQSNGHPARTVALRNFYKGYKQIDKKPGEYISEIWFELPGENHFFNFEKVSKRKHLDIASVNSAISLTIKNGIVDKAGIAAGGVGPIPLFLQKASAFLINKKISDEIIHELIEIINTEISPISDARGSKEYKRLLLGQLIKAHFISLRTNNEV